MKTLRAYERFRSCSRFERGTGEVCGQEVRGEGLQGGNCPHEPWREGWW